MKSAAIRLLLTFLVVGTQGYALDVWKDPDGGNKFCTKKWVPPAPGKTASTCPGLIAEKLEPGMKVVGMVFKPGTGNVGGSKPNGTVSRQKAGGSKSNQ
jgi:hypothetical protein